MATMLTRDYQLIGHTYSSAFNGVVGNILLYAKYNSQNVNNNTSNVTYKAEFEVTNGGYIQNLESTSWNITDGDGHTTGKSGQSVTWYNGMHDLSELTTDIQHSQDGSKQLSLSTSITFGVWNITLSVNEEISLPTIPRKSKITSITADSSPANIEEKMIFNITKYSSNFKDYITMYVRDSYAIPDLLFEVKNGDEFQFTDAQKEFIYSKFPNDKEFRISIAISTYNGDYQTGTFIGTNMFQLYCKVYDADPTFTGLTIEPYNNPASVGNNTLVKTLSLKVNVPTATAKKGASIKSYTITNGEQTQTVSSPGNYVFNNITSNIVKVSANDSRGYSTINMATYTNYVQYVKPVITSGTIKRNNNGVSTNVTLTLEGSFFNGNIGNTANNPYYKLYYKEYGASSYTEVGNLTTTKTNNIAKFNGSVSGDLNANGYTLGKTFDIKVLLQDNITYDEEYLILDSGKPAIAIHEDGVAFGAAYDTTLGGSVQINGTAYYNGQELGTGGSSVTKTSQLINDSGFITNASVPTKTSQITNDSGYITSSYHDSSKQDNLVSGTNIKTINGTSVLGSGNITIQGGSSAADYSTNEHLTGAKWYDGKSIYRKVIVVTSGFSSSMSISHGISNLGEIINVYGALRVGDSDYRPIPSVYQPDKDHNTGVYTIYDGKINYYMHSWWAGKTTRLTIILEYTKTS